MTFPYKGNPYLLVDPLNKDVELIERLQAFSDDKLNNGPIFHSVAENPLTRMEAALARRMSRIRQVVFFGELSEDFIFSIFKEENNMSTYVEDNQEEINSRIGYLRSICSETWKAEYCPLDRIMTRYLFEAHDLSKLSSVLHRQTLYNTSHECEVAKKMTYLYDLPDHTKIKRISPELRAWAKNNQLIVADPRGFVSRCDPLVHQEFYIESYGWPLYVSIERPVDFQGTHFKVKLNSFCRIPSFSIEAATYSTAVRLDPAVRFDIDILSLLVGESVAESAPIFSDIRDFKSNFNKSSESEFENIIQQKLIEHGMQ